MGQNPRYAFKIIPGDQNIIKARLTRSSKHSEYPSNHPEHHSNHMAMEEHSGKKKHSDSYQAREIQTFFIG